MTERIRTFKEWILKFVLNSVSQAPLFNLRIKKQTKLIRFIFNERKFFVFTISHECQVSGPLELESRDS